MRKIIVLAATAALLTLALAPVAHARSANVAALQVALKAVGLYGGSIDGIRGPGTRRAVKRFQRRHRLAVDGVAGRRTRRALGRRGRPRLGSRVMRRGNRGWDVAALQFMLGRRGHPAGSIDGGFGARTRAAVRRFQRAAGLVADGVVGPATLRALRRGRRGGGHRGGGHRGRGRKGGPVVFFRPVRAPLVDAFGMRWGRMHTGIDFPAPTGTRVGAAGRGVVTFAGYNTGGYGYLVIVRHRLGFETYYAHLSTETSYVGERVVGGTRVGLVGSTGHSTGPHLHFEVRRNGTPIDPMPRLLATTAAGAGTSAAPAPSTVAPTAPTCDRKGLRAQNRARGARWPSSVC